jgi:hypothetical protein
MNQLSPEQKRRLLDMLANFAEVLAVNLGEVPLQSPAADAVTTLTHVIENA